MDQEERIVYIHAALATIENTPPSAHLVGAREIALFLSTPGYRLTDGQKATLFRDRRVRAIYADMKERLSVREMPALAAASAGALAERVFDGGQIILSDSGLENIVYVVVIFEGEPFPEQRQLLVLEGASGEIGRLELPAPDGNRESFRDLDLGDDEHRSIYRLLQDPLAHASFFAVVD